MFAGREMPERRSNRTRTTAFPAYGRFLQADPLGYGDGMNMYAYVGNDPVNATDPTGLCGFTSAPTQEQASACVASQWANASRPGYGGGDLMRGMAGAMLESQMADSLIWASETSRREIAEFHRQNAAADQRAKDYKAWLDEQYAQSQEAKLNWFERRLAKATFSSNATLRQSIYKVIDTIGGRSYTAAQKNQVLNDVLRGQSTSIGGLQLLGRVNPNNPVFSDRQVGVISTYVRELPFNALNNNVRSGWADYLTRRSR